MIFCHSYCQYIVIRFVMRSWQQEWSFLVSRSHMTGNIRCCDLMCGNMIMWLVSRAHIPHNIALRIIFLTTSLCVWSRRCPNSSLKNNSPVPHHHIMGWLWLVGSIKLQVSFEKEPYKKDDILQKRPIILWRHCQESSCAVLRVQCYQCHGNTAHVHCHQCLGNTAQCSSAV